MDGWVEGNRVIWTAYSNLNPTSNIPFSVACIFSLFCMLFIFCYLFHVVYFDQCVHAHPGAGRNTQQFHLVAVPKLPCSGSISSCMFYLFRCPISFYTRF